MDGLSIRQGQNLINTGRTASELRASDFAPQGSQNGITSPAGVGNSSNGIVGTGGVSGPGSFQNVLRNAINETNALQKSADVKVQELATGKTTNIPEVMMQVEKADIALRLMTQVRNKIIDAYQEIMKMQV
ncbi:MAG: flagellar hook-basal body complex protein FliE [Deltaproteobacteria bacterium]|jgi:flagellar hook-basal body complex protein FliE|nr:flagellar hook-basal body complex protein FliE [Deltaproteobacteria bacterium]